MLKKEFTPSKSRGFTLIELLIVIAIIALLLVAVVVVINPGKIISKSRDSQRLSDSTSLVSALNLYLADGKEFTTITAGTIYTSQTGTLKVDGTGWLPINFGLISSGSPISRLPKDPTNNATYHYRFGGSPTAKTYEVDTKFEYSPDYTDRMLNSNDGGSDDAWYEVGTDLTLIP